MLRQRSANLSSRVLLPKAALGIGIAVLLASNGTPRVLADEAAGVKLSTIQIFKKVKDNYAAMATYSDDGRVVTARGTIINFSTRLARTNLYLIEWQQVGGSTCATSSTETQAAWSSGPGDYLQTEVGVRSPGNREITLAHAAAFSGGATATVPRIFFDLRWAEEPIEDSVFSVDRQADENVGEVSCYVFSKGSLGATNTLWIGKQDFLIHQVRTVINMETMPGFTATETHINIVLNRRFSRSDFVPLIPLFQSSAN
jgi:hypothetical protein